MLGINGNLILVKVASDGTVEQPNLTVELQSNNPITPYDKQTATQTIQFIFNLNFDLCSFYKDVENDHTMSTITKQLYGLKNPTTPTVFESLVNSIVEQQISIKVARTLEERLTKKFGEHLEIDGESYFAFPTPKASQSPASRKFSRLG